MSYEQDVFRPHLRIAMLRLLDGSPGYQLNDSLLADGCRALGLAVTRDQARTEVSWLAEQGFVTREACGERLLLVKLTERGSDVATGAAQVDGVKRPGP